MANDIHIMRGRLVDRRAFPIIVKLCGGKDLTVVEVGSFSGESTQLFLNTGGVSKIYCVDPWVNSYLDGDGSVMATHDMAAVESAFDNRFANEPRVVKLKGTLSTVTLPDTADLVYVDAEHTYNSCINDINTAITRLHPKVIAGHDYSFRGVRAAIDASLGFADIHLCDDSWIKFLTNIEAN